MRIVVDSREVELYELLCYENIKLETPHQLCNKSLDIGDIIFYDNDSDKTRVIIERKTVLDLYASIKDGRYKEQSHRLNELNFPNHNIIYLIEEVVTPPRFMGRKLGGGTDGDDTYSKTLLYSTIVSLQYYKGFSIYVSKNIKDSVFILLTMATKIDKDTSRNKVEYYSFQPSQPTQLPQPQVEDFKLVTKKRGDNITVKNIGELMLCQIPQVNEKTANVILSTCNGDIYTLITKLKENNHYLDELKYKTNDEKYVKIKKNTIQNILKYLHIIE